MALSLTHATVAVGTDAGNGEIAKEQWNEEHTLLMATGSLLGRETAGTGAVEELAISTFARTNAANTFSGNQTLGSTDQLKWSTDLILTRKAAASLRLGAADAAAPVAQTLGVQSVVAGTTNTAGASLTIAGSQGTGTGAGGSIIFQVAPAGSTGSAQNSLVTFLEATSARAFNLYNTTDVTANYERGRIAWVSNVLTIGTQKAGTGAARGMEFQTDGTSRFIIGTTGGGYYQNDFFMSTAAVFGFASLPSGGTNQIRMSSPSDGVMLIRGSGASFGRLQLGGTTSSFPAIKPSSTILQARLADDSAYAPFEANTVRTATAYTVATLPAAGSAGRRAYVTDATAPTFLGALTGGGAVVCPVFDNGTAWVSG